ncbi:hypothetical protein [uncultured Pseudacidovorax sp.]|uniref:hypothetical protein n=1 Tax=uncultured Pseudacidovorax sp. TaxID=679313 RepID=UPI0025E552F5|nr:hypothetical protein [uncultured Pseudacidovorax sp.]
MKRSTFLLPVLVLLALQGCAWTARPGDREDPIPPRLVKEGDTWAWDRPGAFGPVPQALASAGARVCGSLDKNGTHWKPTGYHAHAEDGLGRPFDGGGYFCVPQ